LSEADAQGNRRGLSAPPARPSDALRVGIHSSEPSGET
jgi:hypothetical protein